MSMKTHASIQNYKITTYLVTGACVVFNIKPFLLHGIFIFVATSAHPVSVLLDPVRSIDPMGRKYRYDPTGRLLLKIGSHEPHTG